jgi:hypothetical protein
MMPLEVCMLIEFGGLLVSEGMPPGGRRFAAIRRFPKANDQPSSDTPTCRAT